MQRWAWGGGGLRFPREEGESTPFPLLRQPPRSPRIINTRTPGSGEEARTRSVYFAVNKGVGALPNRLAGGTSVFICGLQSPSRLFAVGRDQTASTPLPTSFLDSPGVSRSLLSCLPCCLGEAQTSSSDISRAWIPAAPSSRATTSHHFPGCEAGLRAWGQGAPWRGKAVLEQRWFPVLYRGPSLCPFRSAPHFQHLLPGPDGCHLQASGWVWGKGEE